MNFQKCFLGIVILLIAESLHAQDKLSVTSFKKTDALVARLTPVTDPLNGGKCALIRIYTPQKGFVFKPDLSGIAKQNSTELGYELYVPANARQLTILHPQLGEVNYTYPEPIEEMTTYDLVLKSANVTVIIEEEIQKQFLTISAEPKEAQLYINDQYEKNGFVSKSLKPGKYTYRAELPLYYSQSGSVDLTMANPEKVTLKLLPAHGFATITTTPESGADVYIDNKFTGQKTPCTTDRIESGTHKVKVMLPQYQPTEQQLVISDGTTTKVAIPMNPAFAVLNLTAAANAKLYINNEYKGEGSWSGRIEAGIYTLEARKEKHRTAKQDVEVKVGDKKEISLTVLPITGNLQVLTDPDEATILLNGENKGITPATLSKLLIGEYTLTLSKPGYGTITKTVSVTEGAATEVNENLPTGLEVTITSTPTGAQLTVDGVSTPSTLRQAQGSGSATTPWTGTLSFGSHTLKLVNGKKVVEESITVAQNGKTRFEFNVAEFGGFTETTNNLNLEMLPVQGGTFQMGSNQSDDEKPIHSVTLNNYYIGKYEVTQAQWQAIMGSNPSAIDRGIGDSYSVNQVSWNDIQNFIKKLNAKTGKTYRLPTEAEWEYAARGGSPTTYSGSNSIDDVAWYTENSGSKTHPVGGKKPNKLGIYDMTGNVWEWCSDWYDASYYASSPISNPQGASSGTYRVLRGGSWNAYAERCRVAYRDFNGPDDRGNNIGFRLVCLP